MSNPIRIDFVAARKRLEEQYLNTVAVEIAASIKKAAIPEQTPVIDVNTAEVIDITLEEPK